VERCRSGGALEALTLPAPISLRIEFQQPAQADFVALIPGFERAGDRGVRYEASDAVTLFRAFLVAADLARSADD
jgi:D-aminopeptidase